MLIKLRYELTVPIFTILVVIGTVWISGVGAQTAGSSTPPPAQFDMTGFIQEATLDSANVLCTPEDTLLAGGTVTINGIKMVVPCNSIIQMPASSLTWAQLFDPNVALPAIIGLKQTGLALSDSPAPFPSFEVRVVGNVVPDPQSTPTAPQPDRYIVALIVPITQKGLNVGTGIINHIDYSTGELRVGGLINSATTGARVRFNDPVGRFGRPTSPDPRFTADTNNPTIHAATGYPVCIPRSDPTTQDDPLCPLGNRPLNGDPRFLPEDPFLPLDAPLRTFTMNASVNGQFPDARQQAPLKVGDRVDYTGTLYKIDPLGPSTADNQYISAHTLVADLGIYTAPGIPPAYLSVETILLGVGGAPTAGIASEATTRVHIVGFTTDPTRTVDIFAIDVNPCTGVETLRRLGTVDPLTEAILGRFRLQVLGGNFNPPAREYLVRSKTFQSGLKTANDLDAGQYRLPNFDYIVPEHLILGSPEVPGNYEDFPFLALGSGPFGPGGPVVRQLDPWPGAQAPPKVTCVAGGFAPIVTASNLTVLPNTNVALSGTATVDPNGGASAISWSQPPGQGVVILGANTLSPILFTPAVPFGATSLVLTFTLTVSNGFGAGTATATVTVRPAVTRLPPLPPPGVLHRKKAENSTSPLFQPILPRL